MARNCSEVVHRSDDAMKASLSCRKGIIATNRATRSCACRILSKENTLQTSTHVHKQNARFVGLDAKELRGWLLSMDVARDEHLRHNTVTQRSHKVHCGANRIAVNVLCGRAESAIRKALAQLKDLR